MINERFLLQMEQNPAVVEYDDSTNESAFWIVFRKMVFFTLLMTVAPLGSFFIAKDYVFEGYFQISSRFSYSYSAVVAVIVVHIVLISFLIVAFREKIPNQKEQRNAKKSN